VKKTIWGNLSIANWQTKNGQVEEGCRGKRQRKSHPPKKKEILVPFPGRQGDMGKDEKVYWRFRQEAGQAIVRKGDARLELETGFEGKVWSWGLDN